MRPGAALLVWAGTAMIMVTVSTASLDTVIMIQTQAPNVQPVGEERIPISPVLSANVLHVPLARLAVVLALPHQMLSSVARIVFSACWVVASVAWNLLRCV